MNQEVIIHMFDHAITLQEGDTLSTMWSTADFADGKVRFKNGEELKLQMTCQLEEADAYSIYSSKRVRIVWNPQVDLWFVYMIDDEEDRPNRARFCVKRLELHTVGVFGEMKPKYASEGSPSFIGTIARHSTLPDHTSKRLAAHPYAPTKLFVVGTGEDVEFTHGKRVLVDGSKIFCKLP